MKKLAFLLYLFISVVRLCAEENIESRILVFDFGGVVAKVDTNQIEYFLINSFNFKKEELSQAFIDLQKYVSFGGSEKQFWKELAISKKISLKNDWIDQYGIVIKNSITTIPETILLIQTMKTHGYQIAMLSDVTQYQAEIIRKMGYYDLFFPVLLSYEIGVKKPRPEAFQILLQKLNQNASFVLFIDDRIENVNVAKKQGIDSIHFINPTQLKTELKRKVFNLN